MSNDKSRKIRDLKAQLASKGALDDDSVSHCGKELDQSLLDSVCGAGTPSCEFFQHEGQTGFGQFCQFSQAA